MSFMRAPHESDRAINSMSRAQTPGADTASGNSLGFCRVSCHPMKSATILIVALVVTYLVDAYVNKGRITAAASQIVSRMAHNVR
jgi:hypothetical protein